VDLTADFHCVTGWSVKAVNWRGVRIKDVIPELDPRAVAALAMGIDGYGATIMLDVLLDDYTIIAYAMNGKILPGEHGFPLRLVILSRYGWRSVKYLSEIVILGDIELGYWELLGYHYDGDPWKEEGLLRVP